EAAATESSRARASSDIALIKAAVDELEGRQTQADILNALVNRAAASAPRVAFSVVKNQRATGWRARGPVGSVGEDSVCELPHASRRHVGRTTCRAPTASRRTRARPFARAARRTRADTRAATRRRTCAATRSGRSRAAGGSSLNAARGSRA